MSASTSRKRTAEFSASPDKACDDVLDDRPSKLRKADEEDVVPTTEKAVPDSSAGKTVLSFASFSNSGAPAATTGGGFGAYSTNAFAVQAKAQPLIASSDGFAVRVRSKPNLSVNASHFNGSTSASASSSASTSPRISGISPRLNPFSSTSPAHNPFMSFVEKQDDLWKSFSSKDSKEQGPEATQQSAEPKTADAVTDTVTEKTEKPADEAVPKPAAPASFGAWSTGTLGAGFTTAAVAPLPVAKPLFGAGAMSASSALHTSIPLTKSLSHNSARSGDDDEAGSDGDGGDDSEDAPVAEDDNSPKYNIFTQESTVTGEEMEECLLQVRSKMFRMGGPKTVVEEENKFDYQGSSSSGKAADGASSASATDGSPAGKATPAAAGEWIEVGTGPLKILRHSDKTSGDRSADWSRIVMRRETTAGGAGTKLILNVLLRAETVTVAKLGDKAMRISCIKQAEEEEASACKDDKAASVLAQSDAEANKEERSRAKPVTYLLKVKNSQVWVTIT